MSDNPPKSESETDKEKAGKTIPTLINGASDIDSFKNKRKSWASNYLQSIGLSYDNSIYKRVKDKMNSNQDNSNNFLPQHATVTTVANVNLPNIMPTVSCNGVYPSEHSIFENNTFYAYYNNIAPTGATMPTMSYANSNYYFNQTMNVVGTSDSTINYYDSRTTPNTMVDVNLPTTYSSIFSQSSNVFGNDYYYNTNDTTNVFDVNKYYNVYQNQINNKNYYSFDSPPKIPTESNTVAPYDINKTPTAVTDTNLSFSTSDTSSNANNNSPKTYNLSKEVDAHNIKETIKETPKMEVKKCCNCLCSKPMPDVDVKRNINEENNIDKELEREQSIIEANKQKNLKSQQHQANKQVINKEQSTKVATLAHLSSVYLQKGDKKEIEPKENVEMRPKFIKTKYVDEQEPEYKPVKKPRIDSRYEIGKYTNFDYKPIKKTSNHSSDDFTTFESIKFKPKMFKDEKHSSERVTLLTKRDIGGHTRKSETKSTKSYKYRAEDHKKTKKVSPVKSVVSISKKREFKNSHKGKQDLKKSSRYKDDRISESGTDNRKSHKNKTKIKEREHDKHKRKSPENVSDNLVITVNNNTSEDKSIPETTKGKRNDQNSSCKKLNLVINIVYKHPNSRSESDKSDIEEHSQQANVDLSFLDDFNVDEIVASLNKSEKIGTPKSSLSEEPKGIIPDGRTSVNKNDITNTVTKNHSEFAHAEKILDKKEVLNNLLLKEANLLDSLRLVHQEIESGKHCTDSNYTDKENLLDVLIQEKIPTCHLNHEVSENYRGKTYHSNKTDKVNLLKEKSINITDSKTPSSTTHSYSSDLTAHKNEIEKQQSELQCPQEEKIKNRLELIKTPNNLDNDVLIIPTIIDLCNDDSNDNNKLENSIEGELLLNTKENSDDVYIVEEQSTKDLIDLTIDENSNSQIEKRMCQSPNSFKTKEHVRTNFKSIGKEIAESRLFNKGSAYTINEDEIIVVGKTKEKDALNKGSKVENETVAGIKEFLDTNESKKIGKVLTKEITNLNETYNKTSQKIMEIATSKTNKIEEKRMDIATRVDVERTSNNQAAPEQQTQSINQSDNSLALSMVYKKGIYNKASCATSRNTVNLDENQINYSSNNTLNVNANSENIKESSMILTVFPLKRVETDKTSSKNSITKSDKTQLINNHVEMTTPKSFQESNSNVNSNIKLIKEKEKNLKNCDTKTETNVKDKTSKQMNLQNNDTKIEAIVSEKIITKNSQNNDTKIEANLHEIKIIDKNLQNDKKIEGSLNEKTSKQKNMQNNDTKIKANVNENTSKEKASQNNGKKIEADSIEKKSKETNSIYNSNDTKIEANDNEKISKVKNTQKNDMKIEATVNEKTSNENNSQNNETKNKVNEKINCVKYKNKTEPVTNVIHPSTSGTKLNNSPTSLGNNWLATRLEQEMFQYFKQKYVVVDLIHSGTHSKIFRCRSTITGHDYAVKSLNAKQSVYKSADKRDMLLAFQNGIPMSSHTCIYLINSFSFCKSHLCFFMDYHPKNLGQALAENGKPFHINRVQHLARQLVSAVMLLKRHDIVHLDITPEHILLNQSNDTLKLCGFDIACEINMIPHHPNLGTVNYRPPEVIIGYKIGFDVDVWATGLVLYEMATCIKLFPGIHNNDILFKQLCTLGELPIEMIHRSRFSHHHFTGSNFKRVVGNDFQNINIITKFRRSDRIERTLNIASSRMIASKPERPAYTEKMKLFVALLRDMLQVDPIDRSPIQFVNLHKFITHEYY